LWVDNGACGRAIAVIKAVLRLRADPRGCFPAALTVPVVVAIRRQCGADIISLTILRHGGERLNDPARFHRSREDCLNGNVGFLRAPSDNSTCAQPPGFEPAATTSMNPTKQ